MTAGGKTMARQVLRPPDWWFWPKDWINEIKARKG